MRQEQTSFSAPTLHHIIC